MTAPASPQPNSAPKCEVCKLRIDPVVGSVHPCCEQTVEGAYIRSLHPSVWMRPFTGRRIPRPKKT